MIGRSSSGGRAENGGEAARNGGKNVRKGANGARKRLGTRPLGLSLAFHAAAFVFLFWVVPALQPELLLYEVVEINMVAAAVEPVEELVVETPDDPEPEEEAPVIEPEPDPEPEPDSLETPPPAEEEPPPPPEATATTEVEPEDGDDEVTARIEGFRRDFPEYYERITNQIIRCFRPPDTGLRDVVVRFLVQRDGSTTDIAIMTSSGSFSFDTAAEEAIECAGQAGRLGPLPDEYRYPVLPINYTISPRGQFMLLPSLQLGALE